MLFFSGAIIPLVGDKIERLLLHIVFALFLKFGLHYLSFYFWNSEIVGLLVGDYAWSWLVGMKFCLVLPGSQQCYKFFINYVL